MCVCVCLLTWLSDRPASAPPWPPWWGHSPASCWPPGDPPPAESDVEPTATPKNHRRSSQCVTPGLDVVFGGYVLHSAVFSLKTQNWLLNQVVNMAPRLQWRVQAVCTDMGVDLPEIWKSLLWLNLPPGLCRKSVHDLGNKAKLDHFSFSALKVKKMKDACTVAHLITRHW